MLLGVNYRWHLPLLISRGFATAPAVWWGLRCAFTFLAELLLSNGTSILHGERWTVEKRFRVTEVFLAILWVRTPGYDRFAPTPRMIIERDVVQCSAAAYLSYFFADCLMSRW